MNNVSNSVENQSSFYSPLEELPKDIRMWNIFLRLSFVNISPLRQVCSTLSSEIEDEKFWEQLYSRDFGCCSPRSDSNLTFRDACMDGYMTQTTLKRLACPVFKFVDNESVGNNRMIVSNGKLYNTKNNGQFKIWKIKKNELDPINRLGPGPDWLRIRIAQYDQNFFRHTPRSAHKGKVVCFAVYKERVFTGSEDNDIWVWTATTGDPINWMHEHTKPVRCLLILGNRLISGSDDRTIKVWDANAEYKGSLRFPSALRTLSGHEGRVSCLAAYGKLFFSGDFWYNDHSEIRLWNPETGECLRSYPTHRHIVSLAVAGEQLFAALSDSSKVPSWDLQTGESQKEIEINGSYGGAGALAVGDETLFIGHNYGGVEAYDVKTRKRLRTLGKEDTGIYIASLVFSNGKLFASYFSDGVITVWDLRKESIRKKQQPSAVVCGREVQNWDAVFCSIQ
jgi:WD40 repeat protein